MKFLIFTLLTMTLNAVAEERPHLSRDLQIARPAVEVLVQNRDIDSLMDVAEYSNSSELQMAAISAIGVPDNRNAAALLRLLQSNNVELLEGGTEDVLINRELKSALMNAVAQAINLRPPQNASIEQIAVFVAEADRLIKEARPVEEQVKASEQPASVTNLQPSIPPRVSKRASGMQRATAPNDKTVSSIPWSIIVGLSMAALGVMCLLFKAKK